MENNSTTSQKIYSGFKTPKKCNSDMTGFLSEVYGNNDDVITEDGWPSQKQSMNVFNNYIKDDNLVYLSTKNIEKMDIIKDIINDKESQLSALKFKSYELISFNSDQIYTISDLMCKLKAFLIKNTDYTTGFDDSIIGTDETLKLFFSKYWDDISERKEIQASKKRLRVYTVSESRSSFDPDNMQRIGDP